MTIILTIKFKSRAVILFLAGLLSVGAYAAQSKTFAAYNAVTATSNKHYDAQIVNQNTVSKGYNIYYYGPYYTSLSTKTGDANGYNFNNDFVRVMQSKTTKTGTYVLLRYFNKNLGWMNVHGIKPVSFQTIANSMMKQYNVMGTAVLASSGPKNTATVSNGMANVVRNTANAGDGSVVYPLASLQKAMTGAIIQQLISANKLSASTKLSQYYPAGPYASNITIAQMLSMTSGIDNTDITPSSQMTENQAYSSMVSRLKSTNNHSYNYSDANYVLLAGIIAKVTGQSYAQNLQSRIFDKLGMSHTVIVDQDQPSTKATVAIGYTNDGKNDYQDADTVSYARLSAIPGAGNLLSTPSDYYKFIQGLQNGQVLTSKQYQQLTSYGNTYSGGFYVTKNGMKYNNGSFGGSSFHTSYYATNGNYHMALVFMNQYPLAGNISAKAFAQKMYDVATYY
ncbi:class A beta-lactamase-related serine hydrolase [uncultured Lentilactobacillus sp.]|uniref:class A beta-lactamase-related serine hydrolase n=1 Tax=uncultured Lentilactobacillus sp. TaxID=2805375 RepID=UPI002592106C|nr:class A beta-lactamase-related serine hydrolase [uncultured Lentilactobacillus sp.]